MNKEVGILRQIVASGAIDPPKDSALAAQAKKIKTEEEIKKDEEKRKRAIEDAMATALTDHDQRIAALEKDRETLKEDLTTMVEAKM